jgi:transcriptional regulator with XRE-family HTH domain
MPDSQRCPHCSLVQFITEKMACRRCKQSLVVEQPEPKPLELEPEPEFIAVPEEPPWTTAELLADRIFTLRTKKGLSQRQLAEILNCPRTYISKIERGHCLPYMLQLERLAAALEVQVYDLIVDQAEFEVRQLLANPFIAELHETTKDFRPQALAEVLKAAKNMARRRPAMAARMNGNNRREEKYAPAIRE